VDGNSIPTTKVTNKHDLTSTKSPFQGLVSGITIGAYGFGAFIFNFVATGIVNPNNLTPTIIDGNEKYFGPEVADRVPQLFRTLGICYIILGLLGPLLIRIPKSSFS